MSLKVLVPNGRTEITVNGLHQWDYGRTIEIHAAGLPAIVEVHFACTGMETAVVRSCAVLDGQVTAAVPDICLEQTTPIVAWVYAIGDTTGETILTITLPIIPRTKPQPSETIPEDVSDRYTELITEVNEAVAEMNALATEYDEIVDTAAENVANEVYNGGVTAKYAERDSSGRVFEEYYVVQQDLTEGRVTAKKATEADKALKDAEGEKLENLLRFPQGDYSYYFKGDDAEETAIPGGLVSFKITQTINDVEFDTRLIAEVGDYKTVYSAIFYDEITGGKETGVKPMRLVFYKSPSWPGSYHVKIQALNDAGNWWDVTYSEYPVGIYYKHLIDYAVG